MTRLRAVAVPLSLWLLVMAGVGLITARGQAQEREGFYDRFQSRADTGAGFVSAYVDDVFETQRRLTDRVSQPGWEPRELPADAALLGFPSVVLLDDGGSVAAVAPATEDLEGADLGGKYAYLDAALAGTPSVSDVVPSAVGGEPTVAFAQPMPSERFAVVSGNFDLAQGPLASFLARQPIAGTHGTLLDSVGAVIVSPDGGSELAQELASALTDSREPIITSDRVVAAAPVPGTGWTYVLDAPRTTLLAPGSSDDAAEWLLLAAAALVSLAGLLIAQRAKADRIVARREKARLDHRLRLTVEHAPVGMTMLDLTDRFEEPNKRLCEMLGYSAEELGELTCHDVAHPDDDELDRDLRDELVRGDSEGYEVEKRYLRRDGSLLWGRLSVSAIRDEAGAVAYFVMQVEDVTEVRQARTELQNRALYDPLTGLANRSLLMDRLAVALGSDRTRADVGVGFCDLDLFKSINDTHGHHVGDEVLKEVARRLQKAVRVEDTVARLGGDEFVILLQGLTSPTEAMTILERAGRSVKEPIVVDGLTLHTSLSGGFAIAAAGQDPDVLLRDADTALYVAKHAGRGRIANAADMAHRDIT